ncbi:MAG: ABC transporter substrate-binding protein [Flavobacteriia bacterium]|jgi:ABC-type nitrate/sulfonate/bicarbonate transport system substrate-binding protein|nr:ABC transporter substrate-binding protein [Cryomorphaceae bacterium]
MTGLKIGGVPEHFNLPWRMAIEKGKFAELGIDVHWSDMNGGTGQMIRGLETGSIDVAVLLTEGITRAVLQGLKARIVQVYVKTPLQWGIHVPYHSEINSVEDIKHPTFAVSREGSGSHLMAYVLGEREGWDQSSIQFNVVGDIYGGLWALQHDQAQIFLWEKYTTFPFVTQKKCKRVGDVLTPWPCFVIAVREEFLEKHSDLIDQMCRVVNASAEKLKNDPNAADVFSWRYNIPLEQTKMWLSDTEWNEHEGIRKEELEGVVNTLKELSLITSKQAEGWEEKLIKNK